MVLVDAVGGCEENNLQFFTQTGAAITADSPRNVAQACIALMLDEARLQSMTKNLHKKSTGNAAEKIYLKMKESKKE